ncbi:hypothetical protein SAMN02745165_03156 [Malonomonas rubra DSM 5091]|uniref:Uncharacterized protein n=1 Tax=Malonomonas rubra DSM 5091 TaxID=1122189 RepID=A0A1M6M496_MALRU|nr:hypothetical protein [Malonomonas rubra]SHJ78282.1 hypothetical protein SAMN02745165_03156 [Malonomonas rubra DSM 5091]
MNRPDLQQFAQQLALWTELIIENGRTPFRRVDLYPQVHTDQGTMHPPLVFWINRQSMMAGGILLLPEKDLEQELDRGRSFCDALGLKHFVTWETDQVRIWQLGEEDVEQYKSFALQNSDHPDSFRHLLGDVLEALKLLAVIGHVTNEELSPHYLHNLFQTTLDHALPALVDSYRRQRAEKETTVADDADQLAEEANRLLLLQLLGLAWYQKLPSAILPEKLERAIHLSLPELPTHLQQVFSQQTIESPPELPLDAAVCFHHLLLRLRQLSWLQPGERATDSIRLLIEQWSRNQQPAPPSDILLYPEGAVFAAQTRLVLSDSPSLLAAACLRNALLQQASVELQAGNLFQLDLSRQNNATVHAFLHNQQLLPREERQHCGMLLRTSWPNRRFRIPADRPFWYWELLHLLGLAKSQRSLSLQLPKELLESQADDIFWELLYESYQLTSVEQLSSDKIRLELEPGLLLDTSICVKTAYAKRKIPVPSSSGFLRNQILMALELEDDLYQLLDEKLHWTQAEHAEKESNRGFEFYQQSTLSQLFNKILQIEIHRDADMEKQEPIPCPDSLILQELDNIISTKPDELKNLDQHLAKLLHAPQLEDLTASLRDGEVRKSTEKSPDKKLRDELALELESIGIPTFPEQYLYFLEQPEIVTYNFSPPLTVVSELLGQIELEDANGSKLQVYGEELAGALQLCAQLGKSEAELPKDRNQLAVLQQQYWKDLGQLKKQLNSLCHSRLKSPLAAKKLARKVWKKLNLPKVD